MRAAIEGITVSQATGDLGDALNLADALAARAGDAEILVATDAALAIKPTNRLNHKVSVLEVGRERNNQAIVALAVRPGSSAVTRSVFLSIANLDIEPARRQLEIWADGVLIEAKDLAQLEPQTRTEVVIDDVPQGATVIEARLTAGDSGGKDDALTVDDRAWAIVPPDRTRNVLIVGEGDPYLENALLFLPSVNLFTVKPADYPAKATRTDGSRWDLIVFEGIAPKNLELAASVLLIAPPATSDLGEVVRNADGPGHRDALPGRADPQVHRPVDGPHRPRDEARDPDVGADGHPRPGGRAPPLHRRERGASAPPSSRSCHGTLTCRSRWRFPCSWRISRASSWAAQRPRRRPSPQATR